MHKLHLQTNDNQKIDNNVYDICINTKKKLFKRSSHPAGIVYVGVLRIYDRMHPV